MKKLFLLIILFYSCILYSCSSLPGEMPEDFNFRLCFGVNGENCINTFDNTITKDLAADGYETTYFKISNKDKYEIYNLINALDFYSLDNTMEPTVSSKPYIFYELKISCNSKNKTILWENPFLLSDNFNTEDQKALSLKLVIKRITEIYYASNEYKNMKPLKSYYK
jgi:hypothetical protein